MGRKVVSRRLFGWFITGSSAALAAQAARSRPTVYPSVDAVEFHDAEPLSGTIGKAGSSDGAILNTHFRLLSVPKPTASLMLVSDKRVLSPGLDYMVDLQGNVEIFDEAAAPTKTLVAWYRREKKSPGS